MAPNARSVLVCPRMGELEITTVATGHGPLLHHNVNELTGRYRTGAKRKAAEKTVAMFYVSDYGYSDRLLSQLPVALPKPASASK